MGSGLTSHSSSDLSSSRLYRVTTSEIHWWRQTFNERAGEKIRHLQSARIQPQYIWMFYIRIRIYALYMYMHIHVYRRAVGKFIAENFFIQKQRLLNQMKRADVLSRENKCSEQPFFSFILISKSTVRTKYFIFLYNCYFSLRLTCVEKSWWFRPN
jgi:hypothetical protein